MKQFITWSVLAASVAAKTGILLPIYSYPTTSIGQADWASLIKAIDAHPTLDFYVIINDGNGPTPGSGQPNPPANIGDWAPQVDALNKRNNAHPIGYIYTSQSVRTEAIEAVDQYKNWTTLGNLDIHLEGIFFDEINTDPGRLEYNKNIAAYAKNAFQGRGGPVVLNPGGLVKAGSEELFDIADTIVQLETCYTTVDAAYDGTDPTKNHRCSGAYDPFKPELLARIPQNESAKSSILVHDYYETWYPDYQPASNETLEADVQAILNKQVHSFYITQYGWTGNFTQLPASIENVARLADRGSK